MIGDPSANHGTFCAHGVCRPDGFEEIMQPSSHSRRELTKRVKTKALSCGFDAVGVCRASVLNPERERYLMWVEGGRQAGMQWITREWVDTASEPASLLPDASSVICVALSYAGGPSGPTPATSGRIARYADGPDYHQVLQQRLASLADELASLGGSARPFVDTAPTMDKALAARAGIGWQGRNTMLISSHFGSFLYLGGLISNLELEPDHPQPDGCGSCRLCSRACPTGALAGDFTIDSRLCISYLTIEHRGSIPRDLRRKLSDWVFGCDICQDVCPPVTSLQDRIHPELKDRRVEYVRSLVGSAGRRPSEGERE